MSGKVFDRYAVMGNPVAHSKSPAIHAAFAKQTGQDMAYDALMAPLDRFQTAVATFFQAGGKGLNITAPFKLEAWQIAECRTDRAEQARAVNTLWKERDGRLWGDNTDGVGIITDIVSNHNITITGKRVLVLGAGGAMRGILQPLLAEHPKCVVIANRTRSNAEVLVNHFRHWGRLEACDFEALDGTFDLVINGASASFQETFTPIPKGVIRGSSQVYDMTYGTEKTTFMQWAEERGADVLVDGLGMLVEQAAESFAIWRGVRPDAKSVIRQVRATMLHV
ncbi:MAG: shikimate dehydrogenase [Endozoicomonadaceae bacterium]|nr:shikimate dehydrogenase [Endozoicomonadaceae bacterium]